jgi:2-keto-4-pentenoate hydratase
MNVQAIIDALTEARKSGGKMKLYPGPTPPDKEAAFALQSAVRGKLGWKHAGWKIGCTSERAQKALKTDGPFPGPVYAERLYKSGTHLETLAENSRVTEPEIAFTMARDLPRRDQAYGVDEVLAAVASVHAAIEIVNPRCPKGFDDTVEWYIADGGLNHALVLGDAVKPLARGDYAKLTVNVAVNGEQKYSGLGANALGGPELALTWLANDLNAKGLHLRAGDVVTTGVITEVFDTNIGDEVVAIYEQLGMVKIRL